MKKLALITALAVVAFTAYAQQPSIADIEAAKRNKLAEMLAKSGGNTGNQTTVARPEQDCLGALIVCQDIYLQPNSYTGAGFVTGEINNTSSCLGAGELNAVWYKILVIDDGFLGFNLIPNDFTNDYDWAVYNLTNASCTDIFNFPTLEVSCNFSGSTFPTAVTGPNGGPNAQDEELIPVFAGEVYYICISNFSTTNQSGYELNFEPSTISLGNCSHIYGSIYLDQDNNCQLNPSDSPLASQVVYMLPGPYYGISDANGLYHIGIPTGQTGTYQLFTTPLTPAVQQSCPSNPSYLTVQVNNTDSLYPGNNFAYVSSDNTPCPALFVSNMAAVMRPCCENVRYVRICNYGSGPAIGSQLELTYMDNYIAPDTFWVNGIEVSAVQNGNVYTLNLPQINVGDCLNITVSDRVLSNDYAGETTCVLAHTLPDNYCGNTGGWDGSNLMIYPNCINENNVSFTVGNVGTGDMVSPQPFTVYNGITEVQTSTVQLQAGQNTVFNYPANGDLYVMQLTQTNGNPYSEGTSAFVEGCGDDGVTQTGNINMFAQNFGNLGSEMECTLITNSYDPNDKSANPAGIGPQHFISATNDIEYMIRFQNTGTAPADKVVLVDTLDANLDPATIRLGASTHPYTVELTGSGVLTFTFSNINLPPLQQNEAASMGAVTFSVKQRWGLPINYSIHNTAYIYFDLNPPIITNTVFHNVKDNTTAIAESTTGNIQAQLYPNPAGNSFTIKLDALKAGQGYNMQLFTATGAIVRSVSNIKAAENTVDISNLATGLYYYRILTTDGKTAAGMFVKE